MIVANPNVATTCGTPRREVKIDRRDAYALAESLGLGSTVRCGPPQPSEANREEKWDRGERKGCPLGFAKQGRC